MKHESRSHHFNSTSTFKEDESMLSKKDIKLDLKDDEKPNRKVHPLEKLGLNNN